MNVWAGSGRFLARPRAVLAVHRCATGGSIERRSASIREVLPGDVVFFFLDTRIVVIGIALGSYRRAMCAARPPAAPLFANDKTDRPPRAAKAAMAGLEQRGPRFVL